MQRARWVVFPPANTPQLPKKEDVSPRIRAACVASTLSPQGPIIAVGCQDLVGILCSLDLSSTLEAVACLQPRFGRVESLQWSKEGRRLAVCCENGIAIYCRAGTNTSRTENEAKLNSKVFELEVSHRLDTQGLQASGFVPKNEALFFTVDGSFRMWRLNPRSVFQASDFSPFEKVKADECKQLDIKALQPLAQNPTPKVPVQAFVLSPDGRWVATLLALSRQLKIQEIRKGGQGDDESQSEEPSTPQPFDRVSGVVGSTILAVPPPRVMFLPHTRAITSASWRALGPKQRDPCVNVLLTCCLDGAVRLWKEVFPQDSHSGDPSFVLVSVLQAHSWTLTFQTLSPKPANSQPQNPQSPVPHVNSASRCASWVMEVSPGYKQRAFSGASVSINSSFIGDKNEGSSLGSTTPALLVTSEGAGLRLWSVGGLENRTQPTTSATCLLTLSAEQLGRKGPDGSETEIVDIQSAIFEGSCSGDDTGRDKCELSLIMTDEGGIVSSAVVSVNIPAAFPDGSLPYSLLQPSIPLSLPHSGGPGARVSTLTSEFLALQHDEGERLLGVPPIRKTPNLLPPSLTAPIPIPLASQGVGRTQTLKIAGLSGRLIKSLGASDSHPSTLNSLLYFGLRDGGVEVTLSGLQARVKGGRARPSYEERSLTPSAFLKTSGAQIKDILAVGTLKDQKEGSEVVVLAALEESGSLVCGTAQLLRGAEEAKTENLAGGQGAEGQLESPKLVTCGPLSLLRAPDPVTLNASLLNPPSLGEGQKAEFFFFGATPQGQVIVFSATLTQGLELRVEELGGFGEADGPLLMLQALSPSCVALVRSSTPKTVEVWRAVTSPLNFDRLGTQTLNSQPLSLSWYEPGFSALPVLLVATGSRLTALNAWDTEMIKTETMSEAKPTTSVLWALDIPSVSGASWTHEGEVMVLASGSLACLVPELWYNLKSQSQDMRVFQAEGFAVLEDTIIGNAGSLVPMVKEAASALRPILQSHNPECLKMFWTNGQVEVMEDTLDKLKSAMEYSGLRKELVLDTNLDLLLRPADEKGQGQKQAKKDTAAGLFDTFGLGGFGDSEPQSKQTEAIKAVLEMLEKEAEESNPDLKKALGADPQDLKAFLAGLLAVSEGSGVKLDAAGQKFSLAATVSSKQLKPQEEDPEQGIKVQFNIWKVVNSADSQAQAGRVETALGPGVGYVELGWAMLSDSQEEILNKYLSPQEAEWDYIAGLGVPLWLTSLAELKSIVERLAKAQFTKERNPMDCTLMYLCLDKKSTLTAMFKATKNDKLAGFLARDFSDEANKGAAVKNACTLLSQHKDALAAAFFILAGSWDDVFDTVLTKKNDPMLAILLARLNPSVFDKGMDAVHRYFVRRGEMIGAGLTLWRRGQYLPSLQALMEVGENACKGLRGVERAVKLNSILSLCSGLRDHPQVKRALAVQPEVPSMLDAWGGMDTPTSQGGEGAEGKADLKAIQEQEEALRLRAAFELAVAGCPDLALNHLLQREEKKKKERLSAEGVTSNILAKASPSTPKGQESLGHQGWVEVAVSELIKACVGELLGAKLPFTPDWVHPSTLQLKDPEAVANDLRSFSKVFAKTGLVNQADLSPMAFVECAWRQRSDCLVTLCITEATAPAAFEHIFQVSSGLPEAFRAIQVQGRSDTAAQGYMRLAQRISAAARVFGDQGLGLGDWLGEHAETSTALQRMCVTTYSALFLSFWMSRDAAGLTLLLAKSPSFSGPGMQATPSFGRSASSYSSCAAAMVRIFRKALVRCASLQRCSWAGVWAISSKELSAIRASAPQVHADTYGQRHFDSETGEGVHRVQEMAVEMISLSALQALIEQALASEVKGEVGDLVLGMRQALSGARTRMARHARDVASKGTAEEVAAELEPLLLLSAAPQGPSIASDLGAAQVCRAVSSTSDAKVFTGLKDAAASILSAAEKEEDKSFGLRGRGQQVQTRREEVLLSQRGEVLRSLCIRAHENSGTVLAVASNKCIREAHCRGDGKTGPNPSAPGSEPGGSEQAGIGSSVDGVLEMIWDRVATSAAEVVQIGLDGAQGPAQMGAAALAAHPSLPVFLSGGFDGSVLLWGFGAPQPLNHYSPLSAAPISKVIFEPEGRLFAACEGTGLCGVWLMESQRTSSSSTPSKAMDIIQGNSKRIYSLAFLNGGTMLATAGMGSGPTIRVWDLLLPSSKSCVAALSLHDGTANSLIHMPESKLLVSGGHRGDISFTDTRTWRTIRSINSVHKSNVRALAADPSEQLLVSGGTDGDIKVWDVRRLRDGDGESACVQVIEAAHEKGTFLRAGSATHIGTYGVMDILPTASSFYSCGADGRVVRRPWAPS